MAAIYAILEALPDDDARLRVMRWSFGRFNPEFKPRSLDVDPPQVPSPRRVASRLVAVGAAPIAPDPPSLTDDEPAVLAPVSVLDSHADVEGEDIARQILELHDLFAPARPIEPDSFL